MSGRAGAYGALLGLGMAWGLTIPMTKLAVSTGHHPLGLIAWQSIFMVGFLGAMTAARRGRFALDPRYWALFLVIALTGTLVPNYFSFQAAAHLPAGIMALVIALVPMFAFPIALALGMERLNWARIGGIVLGAAAVALIVAPEAALPDPAAAAFVAVAMIAPFCYAIEGNYLAWRGTSNLDPVAVLFGSSVACALISVPAAAASGVWVDLLSPWSAAEWAILIASAAHALAYAGYVWLVGAAGAVFAAQVAYVVTAAGVLWSMALLGERYAIWIWAAFVLMLAGLALVQPRRKSAVPPAGIVAVAEDA